MAQPGIEQLTALLALAFGRPVGIVATERLAPWSATRCAIEGDGEVPASVVVKWLRDDALSVRIDPRQVATERAALEFLAEIGFQAAPRLLAADLAAGVLIVEDLAPRTPLADQLRARGPDALGAELVAFGRTVGELGAATRGLKARYQAIRARYGDVDASVGRERGLGPYWPVAREQLAALGRPLSTAAERDLAALTASILDPGPFLVFSNGDPHPNNFMTDGRDGRLIDFEFADFRHAMVSAVWMHVPGSAWITVAHPGVVAVEAAFRRALAAGVPEAEDDALFGAGLAAACLAEGLERIGRFSVLDARPAGDSGRLQRVATLEAAAAVARRHRVLPDLAGWMEETARWLRRRWPDADVDIAALRPYAPRA